MIGEIFPGGKETIKYDALLLKCMNMDSNKSLPGELAQSVKYLLCEHKDLSYH